MKSVNSCDAAEYHNLPSLAQDGSALRLAGALTFLLFAIVQAVGQPSATVTECTEAALRSALAQGGAVSFACDGTILLSNTLAITLDTVLDAGAHHIVISGANAARVLYLGTNVNLRMANLTIAEGRSDAGAGLYNDGGWLALTNCVFTGNTAVGRDGAANSWAPGTDGLGGALFNGGTATVTHCTFSTNAAVGGAGGSGANAISSAPGADGGAGGQGYGGAIYSSGDVTLSGCAFNGNNASGGTGGTGGDSLPQGTEHGGSGGPAGAGCGGAIFNEGVARLADSTLADNASRGGNGGIGGIYAVDPSPGSLGGQGGFGYGGAICNSNAVLLTRCTASGNNASGGAGGTGGAGYSSPSGAVEDGAGAGPGGAGYGGALYNAAVARLANTTLAANGSTGGPGGSGGAAGVAWFNWVSGANGGNGGTGGPGSGGGVYDLTGHGFLTNCTVAFNSAMPGAGGAGGAGFSAYTYGVAGQAGAAGAAGGGGISSAGGSFLINVLLATNTPVNAIGAIIDGGHNLSSDGSCLFSTPGSLNDSDPLLGPLMDNGGPTLTMALLPGSPAIDAGDDSAAPPVDQRGVPRPAGPASDIGAYELGPPGILVAPASQSAQVESAAVFSATAIGYPPLRYQWLFNVTNVLDGATNAVLQLTNLQLAQAGNYSLVITNAYGAVASPPAILYVAAPGTSLVAFPTQAALQTALAGPGRVVFLGDFTITLTNTITIATNTVVDGAGHHVTISGGNALPVFYVSSNVTFSVANLTIANGLSTNGGGAILNDGGALNLLNTFVQSNGVLLANGPRPGLVGEGGGILNRGAILGATNCTFCGNVAYGSGGGALANEGGLVSLESCLFVGNLATNAGGGPSQGGAIYSAGGQVVLDGCGFTENSAVLARGATNNAGAGGALYSDGSLSVRRCTFVGNSVRGDPYSWSYGSSGGDGLGGALCGLGVMEVTDSTFMSNAVAGAAGSWGAANPYPPFYTTGGLPGGQAQGGALFNGGTAVVSGNTFAWNKATGGIGGSGGSGDPMRGGGGGPGGEGGAALGGAVFGGGVTVMVNCTLGWNEGLGGPGGGGGEGVASIDWPRNVPPGGNGGSGGVGVGALWGQCFLTNCTVALNSATGGAAGDGGGGGPSGHSGSVGGSGGPVSGAMLVNTLLVSNLPTNGLTGALIDTNYNLWADTAAGIIGPLADNGGPTLTMALLPGSPAIGQADSAIAPPADQRGVPRPSGPADIGAYGHGYPPILEAAQSPQGGVDISVSGRAGLACRLLASPDLVNWTAIATNDFSAGDTFLFHDAAGAGQTQKFYRAVMP